MRMILTMIAGCLLAFFSGIYMVEDGLSLLPVIVFLAGLVIAGIPTVIVFRSER